MVFTTSPKLVGASLRAALRHPDVRILNCSVDMPYASIRTYYSRVYEAKFITGAIAAAVAREDRVGYVADTPTFGVPANINAFALGARMVNPRVKVSLQWSCLPGGPDPGLPEAGHHGGLGARYPHAVPPCARVRNFPHQPRRHADGSGFAVLALGPVL